MTTVLATRQRSAQLAAYLQLLAGGRPGGRLVEIRYATGRGGMGRLFVPARRTDIAARTIASLAARADVYCGALLRSRHAGGRNAVVDPQLAWVEIDHSDALARLDQFEQPPSLTLVSGTPGHAHAYWQLDRPVDVDELEQANRKLAHRLGGDQASVDAARILRPCGTLNHKHHPPAAVSLAVHHPARRYPLAQLIDGLDDPPAPRSHPTTAHGGQRGRMTELDELLLAIPASTYVRRLAGLEPTRHGKVNCPFHNLSGRQAIDGGFPPAPSLADASVTDRGGDPLRLVPPPVYFERLTGLRVGRSGKLRCLFHDDRSPSLHVYQEPERGWYCFGCGRGGSIYDLAALLWGRTTRGQDFSELRRELEDLMLPTGYRAPSRGPNSPQARTRPFRSVQRNDRT
jgi:hypothetical protein